MNNRDKFLVGLGSLLLSVAVILSFKNSSVSPSPPQSRNTSENYNSTPSSKNLLKSDINGDISLFKTQSDSILLIDSNGNLKNLAFPIGLVIPYKEYGPLPLGWSECDGSIVNGYRTPDLRNSFILSANNSYTLSGPSSTGGFENVKLEKNHIPKHVHNVQLDKSLLNIRSSGYCWDSYGRWSYSDGIPKQSTLSGGDQAHNNMPPYLALRYICYTGFVSSPVIQPSLYDSLLLIDDVGNTSLFQSSSGPSPDTIFLTDSNGNFQNLALMKGMVMLWYNSNKLNPTPTDIPPGWALCNGQTINGYTTPNLSSKFVLGVVNDNMIPASNKSVSPAIVPKKLNGEGGDKTHTLKINEMPSHSHTVYLPDIQDQCFKDGGGGGNNLATAGTFQRDSDYVGSNVPHENMPPYIILAYICYVGFVTESSTSSSSYKIILSKNENINNFQPKDNSIIVSSVSNIVNLPFPKGIIIAWYPPDKTILTTDNYIFPSGWSLCDGKTKNNYETPDLRGKFILGYDTDTKVKAGITGGKENVILGVENLPSHNHSISVRNYATRYNGYYGDGSGKNSAYVLNPPVDISQNDGGNVGSSDGTADSHTNMPPYVVLCYICYTGENL